MITILDFKGSEWHCFVETPKVVANLVVVSLQDDYVSYNRDGCKRDSVPFDDLARMKKVARSDPSPSCTPEWQRLHQDREPICTGVSNSREIRNEHRQRTTGDSDPVQM